MKHLAYILTIALILSSSFATLNISEIKNLVKSEFDSLRLKPDYETNNLRIDLIRQTYTESVNDSTTETKNTPYHPLGFDIGNGLFYDLNENLCFRIDYLLGISSNSNFEIKKINKPEKNKGIVLYTYNNDSLTLSYPPRKKVFYRYHRIGNPDSISYMYKNRMKYAIIKSDTSMIYTGRKKTWNVINKLDTNQYVLDNKRKRENYRISDNDIFLENDYIVSLTNDNSTVEICKQGKRKNRILYYIVRSKDKIFIYNKKYFGRKIEYDKNSIIVYRDKTLLTKYELKE